MSQGGPSSLFSPPAAFCRYCLSLFSFVLWRSLFNILLSSSVTDSFLFSSNCCLSHFQDFLSYRTIIFAVAVNFSSIYLIWASICLLMFSTSCPLWIWIILRSHLALWGPLSGNPKETRGVLCYHVLPHGDTAGTMVVDRQCTDRKTLYNGSIFTTEYCME